MKRPEDCGNHTGLKRPEDSGNRTGLKKQKDEKNRYVFVAMEQGTLIADIETYLFLGIIADNRVFAEHVPVPVIKAEYRSFHILL